MNRSGLARTRWATLGAALALVLGAGGVLTSSAADTATASSFVPITPCRLADTRPAPDNVGTRIAPIAAGESFVAQVTGTNGNCTIPTTATGVSMNITAIAPTAASFLTVWPTDQTRPLTANLNWSAGQAPTPNAVTATLSSTGSISLYNLSGTVEVTIDIVGYYQPAVSGASGPQGATGPTGARGTASNLQQVLWVSPSGGDYTSVSAAVAAAADASAAKPYLIRIAPGTYTETSTITLGGYIDLEGSGEDVTVLLCACSAATYGDASGATVRVNGLNKPTEIRNLTIGNTTQLGSGYSVLIFGTGTGVTSLLHVTLTNGTGPAVRAGVIVSSARAVLSDVQIPVTGGFYAYAVYADSSIVEVDDSTFDVSSPAPTGIYGAASTFTITDTDVSVTGSESIFRSEAMQFTTSSTAILTNVTARAAGPDDSIALRLTAGSNGRFDATDLASTSNGTGHAGLSVESGSTATGRGSTISGPTTAISSSGTVRLVNTILSGARSGSGYICTNTFSPTLAAVTCP